MYNGKLIYFLDFRNTEDFQKRLFYLSKMFIIYFQSNQQEDYGLLDETDQATCHYLFLNSS